MQTRSTQAPPQQARSRREEGVALLVSVLMMVMVAGIAVAAIGNSREEMVAGGRSRSVIESLFAAEAGVEFAVHRILPPRDLTAFSLNLSGTSVESRARDDATPQPIASGGLGKPPAGYSINIGAGFVNEIFAVHSTASSPVLPTTELEVRLGLLTANAGAY